MSKKHFTLRSILLILITIIIANTAYADDIPQQVLDWKAAADNFMEAGDFAKAEAEYEKVVQAVPGTDIAFEALCRLAVGNHEKGNAARTKEIADKLLADFPDRSRTATSVMGIARRFFWETKDYEKSKNLYQRIISEFPDHPQVISSYMGLACSAINLDDITTANAAVDTIIADYSDHKDYADALSWTAHEYRKAGFQDRAIELYETVLALDANKGAHLRSAGGIAMLQTRLGNDQQVMEKVNYLLSNFDDSPQGVASYISYIVEEYYNKAVFMGDEKQAKKLLQKAINIAELRQDKYPDIKLKNPDDDANYNRCLGDCYRRTQQYQKAVDCYKQSLNTYPENKLAWNVQFQIGRCYDKMSEDNSFDKELAKGKAKLAYQTLLEKYPDCKAAKAVRSHLNKN